MIDTNESLLDCVRRTDAHDAWKLFYQQYWAVIFTYARKFGLSERQAEEVLQETMVTLMRVFPELRHERSGARFRGVLFATVQSRCVAANRRAQRDFETAAPWGASLRETAAAPARFDEAEAQDRWRQSFLEVALDSLAREERVEPRTVAVYRAYVILGRSASAVAAEYGLKENAVYQIKNRVTRRVQSRLNRLARSGEPAHP
jgi:RNA polymerase sigma factor (sigma-70 family)